MNKKSIIIKNVESLSNEKCYISSLDLRNYIDDKKVIKLRCGHCFYYPAFLKSHKINMENIYSYRKCPYCNQYYSNVPFVIKKA